MFFILTQVHDIAVCKVRLQTIWHHIFLVPKQYQMHFLHHCKNVEATVTQGRKSDLKMRSLATQGAKVCI